MARHHHTLTTTQRGLGAQHQALRRKLLAELRDGDPCARCLRQGTYHPMYRRQARLLDVDHIDTPRALGGQPGQGALAHRTCNRSAGAALGNRLRAGRPRIPTAPRPNAIHSRQW